jgi:dihydropteroate synthase
MGVINLTPDSFSDGGTFGSVQEAVDAGLQMLEDGADLLDVGGESTRPGAEPVSREEELWRTMPVLAELCKRGAYVSIDTSKAAVAREALNSGAKMVNDVSSLRDPEMAGICVETGCKVCLMHMKGTPLTMQSNAHYGDVLEEVLTFLLATAEDAQRVGIKKDAIVIDPGIGFGKTSDHNLALIRGVGRFVETEFPVLIGVSRKRFIGGLLRTAGEDAGVHDRLEGSLALQAYSQIKGVAYLRTHDVRATAQVVKTLHALSPLISGN